MNQVPIEQFEAFEAALNNDIISQEHSIPLGKDDATITVIAPNNGGNSHNSLNKNARLENIVDRVQARINEKAVDHFKDEDNGSSPIDTDPLRYVRKRTSDKVFDRPEEPTVSKSRKANALSNASNTNTNKNITSNCALDTVNKITPNMPMPVRQNSEVNPYKYTQEDHLKSTLCLLHLY